MRVVLIVAATWTVQSSNIHVEEAFLKYCRNYCKGGGGFDFCDIGNGNLFKRSGLKVSGGLNVSGSSPMNQGCNKCGGGLYLWDHCNNPATYKCMSKYTTTPQDIRYSNIQTKEDQNAPGFSFVHWFDNNSTLPQSTTLDLSETTSASASFALSTTIDVGSEIDFKVGVPGIFESTFKSWFDVKTTQTKTNTQTKSQTWSISQPVTAPAQSTMKVTLIVVKSTVSADWTAQMQWNGNAKLWCHNKVHGHWEWLASASDFLPAAYPKDCHGDVCHMRGRFEGWRGLQTQVSIQQCKLGSRSCGQAELLI